MKGDCHTGHAVNLKAHRRVLSSRRCFGRPNVSVFGHYRFQFGSGCWGGERVWQARMLPEGSVSDCAFPGIGYRRHAVEVLSEIGISSKGAFWRY